MRDDYVHGYSEEEANRLRDQARTLADLIHDDTKYSTGSRVLEVGCGVRCTNCNACKEQP